MSQASDFGKLRSIFWPVYSHELKKIIPMIIMLFLIFFDYSILRNVKDTIVVTAEKSGAEVIPFIKVWVLLPTAILLTFIFTKLSNRYSQERVFYLMVSGFLLFFTLFTFVLFPLRDTIHPHQFANELQASAPAGFKGLIAMLRYWSFTIFYVMSELWGSIVGTVIFWGFANEITKINESRRFYSILGVGSNFAAICAGLVANYITGDKVWEDSFRSIMTMIIASGIIIMITFRWMNKYVLNEPTFEDLHKNVNEVKEVKKKPKLGMRESFSFLSNSKYLICIAAIVMAYNLVIVLVEIVWKDQLRLAYPSPNDYNTYMNNLTSTVGIISTITAFFMSRLIGRFGWTKTALITPTILAVTSIGVFFFYLSKEAFSNLVITFVGTTPLAVAVFFGAAQVCLSKAAKYSVFDTTKEMAFIPLSHESKLKGKAAIDGVGSRFGKSGGSIIHQGLLMIFGSIGASAPYVGFILMAVVGAWIVATRSLGRQFNALVAHKEQEDLPPQEQAQTLVTGDLQPKPAQ